VSFVTKREGLEALLPAGFAVGADPVVTVAVSLLRELEWLAGRGYNVVSVTFPVVYDGRVDHLVGEFMPVLWENLADPIITGREELGYAKIYAEIPEPRIQRGGVHCMAGWMGFKFLDLRIGRMARLSSEEVEEFKARVGRRRNDGVMHYKYVPKTGVLADADVSYATVTPSSGQTNILEMWKGEGTVQFHEATWEDLPTMVDIVNTLHSLEVVEYRGAWVIKTISATDLSETRALR
jgi:hypothetical protein